MESGERLASPSSAPSSLHMASSSTSSSPGPAPAQPQSPSAKCSPAPSPAAGSPLTTCGHLFRTAGDSHFNMSGISGAFPLVSHPAFGLYTTSSGRSEFGGLGTLGVSAALAAHSQLGTFPDWWRASEAHSRGAAAFFPPLLGLPPIFAAPFQSHDPTNFQSRTPSKNGRVAAKGVNGSINGGSTSSISAGNPLPFLAKGTMEKTKTANGSGRSHKSSQDVVQVQQKSTKEKKLNKKALETSSMSGSQSGSSSDSSSGGESSSDLDDLDEDDDDEDQSNDSEDSDSEKESRVKRKLKDLTQNPAESKKKRTSISEGSETRESLSITSQKRCDDVPPSSSYLPLPSHHNALLRATAALFQSSKPREEEGQQHASVIQATGLVAGSKPLAMVAHSHHRDVSPLPPRSSPKPFSSLSSSSSSPMHFSSSPKHFPLTASPKHFPHSPSPKHNSFSSSPKPLSLCSSPKPLSLCSSPKPLSLSSSPKPPSLSSSPKPPTLSPSHKPQSLTVSPKHTRIMDGLKAGSRNFLDEGSLHTNSLKLKQPFLPQDSFKQTFPLPLKNQDMYKSHKKVASSTSTLPPPKLSPEMLGCRILPPPHSNHTNILPPPHGNHTNLFLNHHPNGVIHGPVQDAPLALLSKPHSQSSKPLPAATSPAVPMPVNLSSDSKEPSATVVGSSKASTSSGQTHRPRKNKAPKPLHVGKSLSKTAPQPLVELLKGTESDIPSSKDSDDSLGDDDDDDDDDDDEDDDDDDDVDSDGSLSESESNPESDSDGSEEDVKERDETDTDAERTPQKLCKTSLHSSSSSLSTSCSPLNLQVIKPPSLPCGLSVPGAVTFYDTGPSSSPSLLATSPGSGKRRRVTDERVLRLPLDFGWQRETRIRTVGGRLQGEVAYYAPCGKKLRQYPDVMKYLSRNGITEISRDNFSFSTKIKVGDFYEAREGPQGLQWCLLTEEEIVPSIIAMDGRRSRHNKSENQQAVDGAGARSKKGHPPNVADIHLHDANEAKLLQIARQAAQIKMMRKLERQAMARAAKEARRQQAIMAAEERRKKKEQMKVFKQQEKIKRIQQIRMEKELRAQQILEAKRKKKEEAANAKILEAEKRSKEKEMRRQQAVILKHQELERHRLDMERERRRQHMMLMKAMEARKKAEERERLKQEKKDEKRLNKERKLELRRLELEIAKELKKPNEDMCLADHKPLPELARIPGLVLPGAAFSDCLTVMQFLRSFGKVLRFDVSAHVPNLSVLQEGLLNIGDCMGQVQDLLVRMLSEAVCDPGLPPGHRTKTALGDHLTNVGITRENVSEILQIYMEAHCVHTELAELALSLKTKAFQAHTPSQKASMLAFLVNELCCSKAVVSEIDKNIDHMTNLRKDKWFIEGKLRKLRSVYAKKTGKRDSSGGGEDSQALGTPTAGRKRKRKDVDSEEDEDEDEDSEDEDDDEDEEEAGGKRGKKADACEEEDDSDQTASVEELEKQIEKSSKQQSQIRRKLFESSQLLRSMVCGQDRYKRRYWVLPQCGGVFVEGMESGEGPDEMEKEREKQMRIRGIKVKEEQLEEEEKPVVPLAVQSASTTGQRDCLNLFLQKPGSFSKLSKLLEVAKMSPELDGICHANQSGYAPKIHASAIPPPIPASEAMRPCSPPPTAAASSSSSQLGPSLLSSSYLNASPEMTCSSQPPLPNDQLFRVLTEKSGHWFSLLPRSPCDESSVTSSPTPLAPSSPPSQATYSSRPISPSSVSPNPLVTASSGNPAGINNLPLSTVQQVKCSAHQTGLPFCGWPSGVASANLTFPGSPLSPMLALAYQHTEGNGSANGNQFLAPTVSTSKSETPEPPSDKPSSVPSPAAVEAAKNQDYTSPQPIPEEMLCGWWKLSEMEELQALVKALHSRGIREKALQKQIQKHMEYMAQACAKNKDVAVIDARRLEEQQVSEETVESWCVEEQAMEVDIGLLQQVEELERRVTSASLQVKGWLHPEPQSEREDLVYHEHKPFSSLDALSEGDRGASQEERPGGVARRPNNPLDIAVTRLSELERNIERRYLKSPLSTTIQIRLDHVGTVTVPAPATACSGDGEGGDEELAPGMRLWRKALAEVRSAAQLSLCVHLLQKSIAWERSIMKVYCQLCQKGDNEELLLLCDGCDRGCHTYCHKPKITTIPEGDWFCPACIAKASDQSPRSKKQLSGAAGGARKGSEVKRNRKPPVVGELCEEEAASPSSSCSSGGGGGGSTPKKGSKESKKMDTEESPSTNPPKQNSPVPCAKKAKTAKDNNAKDLAMCRVLLAELEGHQDAWPFLMPVNPKAVPGYKKIIKKPMDFSTIREKLVNSQYLNLETFIIDVNLVFDNCEKFNEDNSDIGRAGHSMRKFFEKRWTELLKQTF